MDQVWKFWLSKRAYLNSISVISQNKVERPEKNLGFMNIYFGQICISVEDQARDEK